MSFRKMLSIVVSIAFLFTSVAPAFALAPKSGFISKEAASAKPPQRTSMSGKPAQQPAEGKPKGYFTNDYHQYGIAELFAKPVTIIPDPVVNAVRMKLNQDIANGRILSAVVMDSGATDIDIHVTHRHGEKNDIVQRLILDAIREGCLKAQELGLLKADISQWGLTELGEAMRVKGKDHSIVERGSEPVVVAKITGAGIGAANVVLYHQFFVPGATPLVKLGFTPVKGAKDKAIVRGFRAVVRRVDDVRKGNMDGDVWEFEFSSAAKIQNKDGTWTEYKSVNEAQELLALASQPNDYVITEVYAVEGSAISTTEPLVSVVCQPVYGEKGNARAVNPAFIFRSQSGADAVGGVASMFYCANFVPGGPNGERFVAMKPVTLEEARRAPEEGIANVVVYGWQSEQNGVVARLVDHVGINPPALSYIRKLAERLASVMRTHENDQPYVAPFAAEEGVKGLRREQAGLFTHAPKEAETDAAMDEVEERVASGELLSITNDKADMGGDFGHNYVPDYMSAAYRATLIQAARHGKISDGNISGFTGEDRLKVGKTTQIGDDGHLLMIGDRSRNSAEGHQLSFLAFTRAYLLAVASGKKPYGLAQDYQGKEAKAAKANPYFYSHLDQEFFNILRGVMPEEYMYMVDNMEAGWKRWESTKETVTLPEPFSGNVSQQGIGSARFLMDFANGERTFGILAGDKMGPAGINRPIREGVYAALEAGEYENGLVFEIWDAKAFDENGNIPVDKIPAHYADIADAINELKDEGERAFVRSCYGEDGVLTAGKGDMARLAGLIKKSGFVPTERIFLDAEKDRDAIYRYLADSDRFNIKQVWNKRRAGWDINNFRDYLLKPILGSSVTKLGILAGGEYIGKDDPVMVGSLKLMEHIWNFVERNPILLQGDMNGSHWLGAIPTEFKYAVANVDSHPILVGLRYELNNEGKIARIDDVFSEGRFEGIRDRMFQFNFEFKWIASLGGQFAPYGTDVRTVEASYPLAKLLRQLNNPESPFLVKNKPAERERRPIDTFQRRELFARAASVSAQDGESPQRTWIAGEYTPAQVIDAGANTQAYLDQAGRDRRIFSVLGHGTRDIAAQVKEYAAHRTTPKRQLPYLDEKGQKALAERLRKAAAFHRMAIAEVINYDSLLDQFPSEIHWIIGEKEEVEVEVINGLLNDVRHTFVLDEADRPFFSMDESTGQPVTVTASSGEYKYDGFDGSAMHKDGVWPKTIYMPLSMIEGYMALGDAAKNAYIYKILHEFLELESDSKRHRQEIDDVTALINAFDQKVLDAWKVKGTKPPASAVGAQGDDVGGREISKLGANLTVLIAGRLGQPAARTIAASP